MATSIPIPSQQRAAGTYTFGPATNNGFSTIKLTLTIPTTDYENTANQLTIQPYYSPDGGTTWQPFGGWVWQGGRYVDKFGNVDPDPIAEWGIGPYNGMPLQVSYTLAQAMTLGGTITLS